MVKGLPNVVVVTDSSEHHVRAGARALAARLNLPLTDSPAAIDGDGAADFILFVSPSGLEVREPGMKAGHGLSIDFTTLNPRQAARNGGFSRNQPLARAMGRNTQTVIDCTAGLGHDAALLACIGFDVIAIERSPIVAALLEDALERADQHEELREALGGRLRFINAEARDILASSSFDPAISCAYIDPMFPPKRKSSALAKKEIRMIRALVGEDADAADLLAIARANLKRVVVKRPTYATPLAEQPAIVLESKLVRYDIYMRT